MTFKVGEIYKDREGGEYRFIAHIPDAEESQRLVFMKLKILDAVFRYSDGALYLNEGESFYDVLPHEKKTVKLYPALCRNISNHTYWITSDLYETKPERAIRLLTEWSPVIIEVEE